MREIRSVSNFIDSGGIVTLEVNEGPVITDATGYIPASRYIEQMLEAGVLLERQRARNSGEYEYTDDTDIDDITVDPTRRKSFDAVDAQVLTEVLESKFKKARKKKVKEDEPLEDTTPKDTAPKDAENGEAAIQE